MSHNRQAYAAHTSEDTPSRAAGLFTDVGQPPSQQYPAPSLRQPQSNSTLADSIRALREHKSPTAAGTKIATYTPSSLASSSSPLSSTSEAAGSLANRRKAGIPSPLLQQEPSANGHTKLYGRQGLHSPLSPKSLQSFALPPLDLPSSPKERIEALLAQHTPTSSNESTGLSQSPRKISEGDFQRQMQSHAQQQSRSPSLPLVLAQAGSSTSVFPTATVNSVSSRPSKITSMMPRNSSIDSTVSTLSSATTASQATRQNSSISKGVTEPDGEFDAAAFVAQAGSVESALLSLWKDKQNTASHNAQLWRLVEKQRAVLLGLQKDMDKAFKEREKYRKRLKDHLAACSSSSNSLAPSNAPRYVATPSPIASDAMSDLAKTPSITPMERTPIDSQFHLGSQSTSPKTTLATPKPFTHHYQDSETLGDLSGLSTQIEEKRQTAINLLRKNPQSPVSPPGTSSDHTSSDASPITSTHGERSLERMETPLTEPSVISEMSPVEKEAPKQLLETYKPLGLSIIAPKISPPPTTVPPNPPILAITNATPIVDAGKFPSPPKPANSRKPVPAPLMLVQSNLSPSHEKTRFDTLSPVVAVRGDAGFTPDSIERGRRRTRQDDDMVREVMAFKEEEARSASMKSKSKTTTPLTSPTIQDHRATMQSLTTVTISGPVSPQVHMIPPSPRLPSNMTALLSPALSDSSTRVHRNSIAVPLLSPGLPMSPRPSDRPANSPTPRDLKVAVESSSATKPPSPRSEAAPAPATMSLRTRATPPLSLAPLPERSTMIAQKRASALPAPLFFKKQQDAPVELPPHSEVQAKPQREPPPPPVPEPLPMAVQRRPMPARSGSKESTDDAPAIFKGFMSDPYPDLLIAPNALPLIEVRVVSSRMRPSRNSILLSVEEDPVFLLGIYARADGKQLWRVEKNLQALVYLHNQIKSRSAFDAKIPDAALFQGHAPAKIDARREALNAYFGTILDTPLSEDAAVTICGFFSVDALEPEKDSPVTVVNIPTETGGVTKPKVLQTREGYLTKRGKNFGGWKARYFVLDGPELKYYDNLGGPQIGVIRLYNAQIGKQSSSRTSESPMGRGGDENQYRHAFLVLEPKKKDSSSLVRHVLCAESDEERDAWVEACLGYVDVASDKQKTQGIPARQEEVSSRDPDSYVSNPATTLSSTQTSNSALNALRKQSSREIETPSPAPVIRPDFNSRNMSSSSNTFLSRVEEGSGSRAQSRAEVEPSQTLGMSYESTVQAEAPMMGQSMHQNISSYNGNSPSPSSTTFPRSTPTMQQKEFTISGPTNGAKISDMASWGLKASTNGAKTPAKEKKRSIFGFATRTRSSSELNANEKLTESSPGRAGPIERQTPLRSVFGMPIAEAVEMCPPEGVDAYLPAVVYRSIEYLRAMEAADEEGIFRLSGSNVTIKSLRERFNNEGDVDLMDGEYCDIHAVASLLKLYLRELPQSILTRDLHMQFLDVNSLNEHQKKVKAANVMVHKLPKANYHLLEALCSFLGDVVNNSEKNKMNVRNVGIVFAPTLNIAAWLISLLITDFNGIFGEAFPEELSPISEVMVSAPEPSDALRSPRHQLFGDLPTPNANQTNFPQNIAGFSPMNTSTPNLNKIQSRTTYVPLGPQMHSQGGTRKQPAPIGPQHLQTQPHNEWAGPAQSSSQFQQQQSYRRSQHPSFPHPSALGVGPLEASSSRSIGNSPHNGASGHPHNPSTIQQENQNGQNNSDYRRNRRESAMMGGDYGLVNQRGPQRQTLTETNSSRQSPQFASPF